MKSKKNDKIMLPIKICHRNYFKCFEYVSVRRVPAFVLIVNELNCLKRLNESQHAICSIDSINILHEIETNGFGAEELRVLLFASSRECYCCLPLYSLDLR